MELDCSSMDSGKHKVSTSNFLLMKFEILMVLDLMIKKYGPYSFKKLLPNLMVPTLKSILAQIRKGSKY
jgi:hypothetical protein